jgi:hypothetical protein
LNKSQVVRRMSVDKDAARQTHARRKREGSPAIVCIAVSLDGASQPQDAVYGFPEAAHVPPSVDISIDRSGNKAYSTIRIYPAFLKFLDLRY